MTCVSCALTYESGYMNSNCFMQAMEQRKMTDFLRPMKRLKIVLAPAVLTLAIVYEWIFTPPFNHVLKGIRYIGQTIQDLDTRTRQHKSSRDHKDVGLHALWCAYPYGDHWQIRPVTEKRFVDREKACEWMDREEKRLISEHGGPLRDMDSSLKQTLNLTAGGQGDPQKRWEAILAISRSQLNDVWPAFNQFYLREKHLRIKTDSVEEVDGFKVNLGSIVNSIRSQECFVKQHVDFKEWLDEHGFVYDENQAHFELDVWPVFKQFYDREKHLRIKRDHVEEVDGVKVKLGNIVWGIRKKQNFLQHVDFRMWLWCACFQMCAKKGKTAAEKNRRRWEAAMRLA